MLLGDASSAVSSDGGSTFRALGLDRVTDVKSHPEKASWLLALALTAQCRSGKTSDKHRCVQQVVRSITGRTRPCTLTIIHHVRRCTSARTWARPGTRSPTTCRKPTGHVARSTSPAAPGACSQPSATTRYSGHLAQSPAERRLTIAVRSARRAAVPGVGPRCRLRDDRRLLPVVRRAGPRRQPIPDHGRRVHVRGGRRPRRQHEGGGWPAPAGCPCD